MKRKEQLEKKLYTKGLITEEFNELIELDNKNKEIIKWADRKRVK